MQVSYARGLKVTLYTPENPILHGAPAVIDEITDYGAVVKTEAAATGQFRALFGEMIPRESNGRSLAAGGGYTGDACAGCGSFRVRRNGNCTVCDDCGSTSGCS